MAKVDWPCEITSGGIASIPLYYWETNKWKFTKPQRFASVDCRLFIALAAAFLDVIKEFGLKAVNTHGIYNPRPIRGNEAAYKRTKDPKYLSTHAYGIAIDIKGFLANDIEWWVETPPKFGDPDLHKPFLALTATELMKPYFPDIVTWDKGQWRGGFPHQFSARTAQMHRNHYHLNVSVKSRFRSSSDKWHKNAVKRLVRELRHTTVEEYQQAKGLIVDGVPGQKTSRALVIDFGGKVTGG